MVSFVSRSDGVHKRRRTSAASLPTDALTPVQLRQTARCRKQTLTAKLSDSGFEEDLGPSPCSSSGLTTPLRSEELPTWYLQYGDVGYLSQREREAHFHPCKSLARQPQVGYMPCYYRRQAGIETTGLIFSLWVDFHIFTHLNASKYIF